MAGAIAQDRESCQFPFVPDEKPLSYRSARPESGREGRERYLIVPLGQIEIKLPRRLALAGGFRLLRSLK